LFNALTQTIALCGCNDIVPGSADVAAVGVVVVVAELWVYKDHQGRWVAI